MKVRDMEGTYAALKRCEEELRTVAAEAAAAGDYDRLARIAATARRVLDLASEWQGGDDSGTAAEVAAAVAAPPSSEDPPQGRARGSRHSAARNYPRFMRRGDELVKIGWSKAGRKEYQHRAPHSLLVALRQALLDASRARKLFTMDTLERSLAANNVPGYQAYAWLAWLRSADLVKQHGRQGYSLIKAATFETDIEKALIELPAQGL
ncbi:hypothetical protein [Luteitalea pratensis]|nr:hypothetical protein [Luteitalea pratensis]